MPAYSFKERFVHMVMDGSKRQTIRAYRKSIPKPGQPAHLYYGMRTKWCRKLVDPSLDIKKVQSIIIYKPGIIYLLDTPRVKPDEEILFKQHNILLSDKQYNKKRLSDEEADQLAWRDGFRVDDLHTTTGCLELMLSFWKDTHSLPFIGNIIYW